MGRKRALRTAAAVAATIAPASVALAARVYCGGPNEVFDAAAIPLAEQFQQPHADALSSHCNGVCASRELCVFRSSPQYSCASTIAATATVPACVRGATCTYECIATTTMTESPMRWGIEWTHGGMLVHTSAIGAGISSTAATNATAVLLPREINRIDRMELPGNVIELVIRGYETLTLELMPAAIHTYNALVRLELADVRIDFSWRELPHMAHLKSLSLVNASLARWPLTDAQDPLTLESLDLRMNPGIQVLPSGFGDELRILNLADCGLRSLPDSFTSLQLLRELFLDRNPLVDAEVALPPHLQTLSLRGCGLTGIPPAVAGMRQLTSLDLAQNPELGQRSITTESLPFENLLKLNVADCGLDAFPFDVLASSPLRTLILSNNPLSTASVATLASLGAIEDIDLSSTGVTSVPPAIAMATTLKSIDLAGNPITSLPDWPASQLLESLSLSRLRLEALPHRPLPSTLVSLDVSFNAIRTISLPQDCTLRRLNVSSNAHISILSIPSALEELVASNCSLSALPTATFNWGALRLLNLSHNALTTLDLPVAQGYSFEDLDPERAAVGTKHLDLDLSTNHFASFPSALLSLSPYVRSLDLRGNPFDLPLTLTTSQFTFLSGLEEVRVDAKALSTKCPGSARQTLPSGTIVCVGSDAPGTIQPFRGKSPDPSTRDDDQSSSSSGSSGSSVITNAVLGAVTFLVITAGLVVTHRRRRKHPRDPETGFQRPPSRRPHGIPSILSIPTDDPQHMKAHIRRDMNSLHQQQHQQQRSPSEVDLSDLMTSDSAIPPVDMASACLLEDITDDLDFLSWRVRPQNVRLLGHVATGPSSFLYRGILNVVDEVPAHSRPVAVKKLPPHQTHSDAAAIERLAKEVRMLALFQHPKIVQFFGVSWTQRLDLQIVLEWMPDGDLRTMLAHHSIDVGLAPVDRWIQQDRTSGSTHATCRPGFSLHTALDVVDALVYLHSVGPQLVRQRRYWRLTSHKVILDSSRDVAKLCDLGASSKERLAIHHLRRWFAPEVLAADAEVDDAGSGVVPADVYAFGILLAELDTFTMPFHHVLASSTQPPPAASIFPNERSLLRVLVRGQVEDLRPLLLSESCPDPIAGLVHWCTLPEPSKRPTATQIANVLRAFAAQVSGLRESSIRDDVLRTHHTNRASEVIQTYRRTASMIYLD